ncbi:endonuclease/exonuclease/phosphatase family protein [Streptomyces sp. NPDC094468]|uniref:endonuclease/exonuclease/phosphatase family protein n=1 Tax=Streptomyces sp. NPDC094468 TaxID=3366066 RepID=UPI003824DBE3
MTRRDTAAADTPDTAAARGAAGAADVVEPGRDGSGRRDSGAGSRTGRARWAVRGLLRRATRPGPWRRGRVLAVLALLLGLVMLLHAGIPNGIGHLGSLVESLLPWCGLFVPVLLAAALWRRSATAVAALLLPAVVWLNLFGGLLADKSLPGGDLTVACHNVDAGNPDPAGTARALAASGADVLALEELTGGATDTYEKVLARTYPHHAVLGTVGLWSRLPLSDTRPVDIGTDQGPLADTVPAAVKAGYNRALRTTVATAHGPLVVYVAHLGSVRLLPRTGFWTSQRDAGAQALARAVAAERTERVVLLGDLNGTTDDRAFAGLTGILRSAQEAAGDGFGFTWPAAFPVARIDQILVRGVRPRSSWVLPATGSDHRPVAARVSW